MDGVVPALAAVEAELGAGGRPDLRALGFWRAVASVKRDPLLVARHADRIARIDREAFSRSVPVRLPAAAGVVLLVLGALFGLTILALAASFDHPLREIALVIGMGALDVATHGLAHLVVGSLVGIRFTHWFVDLFRNPAPGFKIDYASYLRAPARSRAWMHASGAIVTKVVPFAVLAYALSIGAAAWALVALLAFGVLQLATDVLFSVRASDWKKYRREMRLARSA